MERRWSLGGLAVVMAALTGCAVAEAPVATDVVLIDTDGERLDLDAALARGEHVALVFWQTWCESCAREAPTVAEARRRWGQRLRFVGVVPGRDADVDDAEVARVRAAWGYDFPQVRDRDLSLARRFGVEGTPTIVVLGAEGRVRYRGSRAPADWEALQGAPLDAPIAQAACEDGVCPLPASPDAQ